MRRDKLGRDFSKAAGLLVALACLHFVYGGAAEAPQASSCARGSEEWRVYDADAGHLWNRLYWSLYPRTARDGRG